MHGRHIKEAIDEQPPPIRTAWYLGPGGTLALLVTALISSSTAVCMDHCLRVGDALEDRLLECMDRCEVTTPPSESCEKTCQGQVKYTRRQVQRQQSDCNKGCDRLPATNRLLAFAGVMAVLPVVPLLGTYRDACSCECCKGLGCSPKLALFIVAWTAYGFSTLWVVPSVAEDAGDVGGKVFFLITQGLAIASMAASRRLAELAEVRASESNYRMAEFGCTGAEMVGATVGTTVGSPVMVGPAMNELQSTVERLDQQVQELNRRQAMMEKELASRKEAPRDLMQTDPIGQDNTQELL